MPAGDPGEAAPAAVRELPRTSRKQPTTPSPYGIENGSGRGRSAGAAASTTMPSAATSDRLALPLRWHQRDV